MGQTNEKPSRKSVSKSKNERAARFDSTRFVQYELDATQIAACKAWDVSTNDLWGHILSLADDGYSVTFKFDSWSEAYACFIQVRGQDDHVNTGLILTGRGSEPHKALKQAVFKMDAIGPSWVQFGERRKVELDD